MKAEKFYDIVEVVSKYTSIPKENIFSASREQPFSDARHLLFFIAHRQGFKNGYIRLQMELNGRTMHYSAIKHGIDKIESKLKSDPDFKDLVASLLCEA